MYSGVSVTGGVNPGIVSFKSTSFYDPLVVQEERRKGEEGKKKKSERKKKKKAGNLSRDEGGRARGERLYGGVYFRILRSSP